METGDQTIIKAYAVVRCFGVSKRSAEATWQAIGAYTEAGRFLDVTVTLEAGNGEIGSIRRIGDAILEAKVGETPLSYTYIQTVGPMARFGYHGCLAVEPKDASRCHIHYTLTFDRSDMDDAKTAAEIERLGKRFQGAVDAMCADGQG